MLVRGYSLQKRMSQYLVDQISETENIHVRPNTSVAEVDGKESLQTVTVEDSKSGERETLSGTSMFIFIGAEPFTEWLSGVVARDEKGFILAGPDLSRDGERPEGWRPDREPYLMESSVPGIFVAGDVAKGSTKRIAYSVGGGAVAVQLVHQYLREVV